MSLRRVVCAALTLLPLLGACTPFDGDVLLSSDAAPDAAPDSSLASSPGDATGSPADATVAPADATLDGSQDGVGDSLVTADVETDAGVLDSPQDVLDSQSSDIVDASPDAGQLVWVGASVADPASGITPAVALGSVDGPWVIQAQGQYPSTPGDEQAPRIDYQSGSDAGALGPSYELTHGASQPGMTALTSTGGVLVVYTCAAPVGQLCWFSGQYQFNNPAQRVGWPYALQYDNRGYRPRVAAVVLPQQPLYQEALVVEVHMLAATAGELGYRTAVETGNGGDAAAVGGPNWNAASTVYDNGPSQNPAVAVSQTISAAGAALVLEVHQDSGNGLWYRQGILLLDQDAALTAPLVLWETPTPYPDQEEGANPAVAIYGQTIVEVHESLAGALLYKVGRFVTGGVLWGASQQYETQGMNPAIAIDPQTGSGVEVHESRTTRGQLFDRTFTVLP